MVMIMNPSSSQFVFEFIAIDGSQYARYIDQPKDKQEKRVKIEYPEG
jgi:hypothetical protein